MYNAETYAQKKSAAQEKLTAYVDVVNTQNHTKAAEDSAKKALDTAVAEYNALVISDAYERLFLLTADSTDVGPLTAPAEYLKSVDPLGRAFRAYRFAGLMKPEIKREKDTGRVKSYKLNFVTNDDEDKQKEVYHLRELESKWDELQTAAGVTEKVPLMASSGWSALVLKMRRLFRERARRECKYEDKSATADCLVYLDGSCMDVADMTAEQKKELEDKTSIGKLKTDTLQPLVDAIYFDNTGRKNGSNKYRVAEKDVNWVADNGNRFDERQHKTILMGEKLAYELVFCMVAHIVTGEDYKVLLGE